MQVAEHQDGVITALTATLVITINQLQHHKDLRPGTYTVVATAANGNDNGNCTATTTVTIGEPIEVTVSASATNVSCNGASDGTITASGSDGSVITINGLAPAATTDQEHIQ
jgi:PKD repeat protein